jgi:methyl-accepting chemotaxis protein WspA
MEKLMFKNMTLPARMMAAFMFMGLIVLIVALVGWSGTSRLSGHINTFGTNSLPSVIGLWKVNEGQTQIQSSERALLDVQLNQQERQVELTRINQAWQQIEEGFKDYEPAPRTQEEDKVYEQMKKSWDIWKKDQEAFLALNQRFEAQGVLNPFETQITLLRQNQGNSPAMAAAQRAAAIYNQLQEKAKANRSSFQAATNLILENLRINEDTAARTQKAAANDISQTTFWVVAGLVIGPVTAIIFGWFLSTTLVRKIQSSGIQIMSSVTQISSSGKQLEATVNEQVASTNEVVATAREIAATSGQLVKTMGEVSAMSEDAAAAASGGQKELARMESGMQQLANSTSSISGKLGAISEKANNINSIVTTITKVADQTNLLSLNAAIEAEKAGDYGMGFAVVAREIRRLADQTAVATLDIESMVKEMQSAVSSGVMEMDKFTKEVNQGVADIRSIGVQLEEIIEQVQSLTPRFDAVNRGMTAQSEGAQQISEAMAQLSEATLQTAGALREINGAIAQLNHTAQSLRQEISRVPVAG